MAQAAITKPKSPLWMGILPFIGVILFLISLVFLLLGEKGANWQQQILVNAIVYMIGWAGIGAGISHLFFGEKTSASIGFGANPYEFEVGFADLSFGIVGVLASSFSSEYWLAIILVSSIYRVGCGIGHIRQMVKNQNYAINNTAILFVDFVVPAFLVIAYWLWA